MTDAANKRMVYHSRLANYLAFGIFGFGALAFLVKFIKALDANPSKAALVVFAAVLMVAFLVPTLRFPFNGVVATDGELRVRNILKTHVLRWDQVERFELTRCDPWPRVGVVVLTNGRRIAMSGVQAVPYEWSPATKFAKRTVAALNQQLAVHRSPAGSDTEMIDDPFATGC